MRIICIGSHHSFPVPLWTVVRLGLPSCRGCLASGGPMNFVFFQWDALGHPQTSLSWLIAHSCIMRQGIYSNALKIPVVAVLVILGIFPLEILSIWFPIDVLSHLILSPIFACPWKRSQASVQKLICLYKVSPFPSSLPLSLSLLAFIVSWDE